MNECMYVHTHTCICICIYIYIYILSINIKNILIVVLFIGLPEYSGSYKVTPKLTTTETIGIVYS